MNSLRRAIKNCLFATASSSGSLLTPIKDFLPMATRIPSYTPDSIFPGLALILSITTYTHDEASDSDSDVIGRRATPLDS